MAIQYKDGKMVVQYLHRIGFDEDAAKYQICTLTGTTQNIMCTEYQYVDAKTFLTYHTTKMMLHIDANNIQKLNYQLEERIIFTVIIYSMKMNQVIFEN